MNTTTSLTLAFCLLATFTTAVASPSDSVAGLLQRVAVSPTKTLTFFQGLADLEDCDVGGSELQAALRKGGVQAEGLLGAFLSGLERIHKRGRTVVLTRSKTVQVETGSGLVEVGDEVAFRINAADADSIKLVRFRGARAGLGPLTLLPVRTLALEVDAAGQTTAALNVGYGFLSKTVEVALASPPAAGLASGLSQ